MKLLFKQRIFSWFDSYDICDEQGQSVYTVLGKLDWGHTLEVYDPYNQHVATLKQVMLSFLPKFTLYVNDQPIGEISKDLNFFIPSFTVDCNGWHVEGDILEWNYQINSRKETIATITRQLFNFSDTFVLDVVEDQNALLALLVVLAIDAAACSSN